MAELDQTTDQPSDFTDTLSALLKSVFSPSEAGAATTSDQFVARALLQQRQAEQRAADVAARQQAGFQQQEKMLKERGVQQQADPLYQAKVAAAQAKAQPRPSLAELLGGGGSGGGGGPVYAPEMPGDVLGGGPGAPITFGRNPRTGDYSFNNFGYVNDPTSDARAPSWITGRAADVARQYSTPEMQQQVEQARQAFQPKPVQPGQPAEAGLDPAAISRHAEIVSQLVTYGKYSPTEASHVADLAVPQVAQAIQAQKLKDKQSEVQSAKDIAKSTAVAPKGLYLDKGGVPYSPMYGGDVTPGTAFYQQGSAQQQVFEASGMINTHVDETLNQLQAISKLDRNRFTQYLNTELKRLRNDPHVNALTDLLGPATAMAVARAYAAGGGRMQGGVRLAEMFKNGVYSEGDTLRTSLEKLRTLESINLQNAQGHNLHPEVVKATRDRIEAIDKIIGGKAPPQTSIIPKVPTGRVPMFDPQGKPVHVPAEQVDDAINQGFKPYQQ